MPRILVEKDLLSFATFNALNEKSNNNGKLNQKYNEQLQLQLPLNKENKDLNNNFFSEKELLSYRGNDNYIEKGICTINEYKGFHVIECDQAKFKKKDITGIWMKNRIVNLEK